MFMAAVIERFGWPVSASGGRSRARVSSAVCAFEQPGLHGADAGGAGRCGMVVV